MLSMKDGRRASDPVTDIEDQYKAAIGARLRAELRRTDTTPTELAETLGVAPTTIARYANGKLTMSAAMARRIEDALGCNPGDLLRDEAVA